QVVLDRVIPVKCQTAVEVVAEINRTLIDIHRGGCGANEPCARRVVGYWNEAEQLNTGGIPCRRNLGPLSTSEHDGVQGRALALACALIARKKVSLILHDRTTKRGAELVALERRLRDRCGVEEVSGIESFIAQELERLSMIGISTGTRGNIHNGA